MNAKKKILATAITCVLVLLAVSVFTGFWTRQDRDTSECRGGIHARADPERRRNTLYQ